MSCKHNNLESTNERRNENKTARHDIEIGKEAIVGAMSLVNKSVADGETVVGVPAKPLIKNKEINL